MDLLLGMGAAQRVKRVCLPCKQDTKRVLLQSQAAHLFRKKLLLSKDQFYFFAKIIQIPIMEIELNMLLQNYSSIFFRVNSFPQNLQKGEPTHPSALQCHLVERGGFHKACLCTSRFEGNLTNVHHIDVCVRAPDFVLIFFFF